MQGKATEEEAQLIDELLETVEQSLEFKNTRKEDAAYQRVQDMVDMIKGQDLEICPKLLSGISDYQADQPGDVRSRNVTVEENIDRRNYRDADNIDFHDGDIESSIYYEEPELRGQCDVRLGQEHLGERPRPRVQGCQLGRPHLLGEPRHASLPRRAPEHGHHWFPLRDDPRGQPDGTGRHHKEEIRRGTDLPTTAYLGPRPRAGVLVSMTTEQLHACYLQCSGPCTDTRSVTPGAMFFALTGPNFNANAFAAKALEDGCRFAVVDDPGVAVDERYLVVPDVLKALQDVARHHRRTFDIPVIGITGSNGKTTTKELLHAVLEADRPTLATIGNLNNHIGVPLTLLRLTAEHRVAIIEMGANKVGDIAELTAIAEPTHGLITNIGKAHLEGFGGPEGVIKAKTEMYAFVRDHAGTLFVNADDPLLMEKSGSCTRVTYGSIASADTVGHADASAAFLSLEFIGKDGTNHTVATRLIGAYNLPNALVAIAIGQYFGIPDARIASALAAYAPSNNRSQFTDTGRNQLVLDAYNANPTSMAAALHNFAAMASERPKLAILGGMKELGADSNTEHEAIVALVRSLELDAWFVGPEFQEFAATGITALADAPAALEALAQRPIEGKLILVKGSRGTKLETLVPRL